MGGLLPRPGERVALHHESHVQHRERHKREAPRREHAARQRRGTGLQDDRHGMEGAEQVHAEVDERHQAHAADPQHRRIAGPGSRLHHGPPQQQVPYIKEEEEQGGGEPGIPGPPRAPDGFPPDGAGGEHDGGERRPHLRRGRGKRVQPRVLQKQIEDARQAHQDHGRLGPDRRRNVDVEDLLRRPLRALDGGKGERAHVHRGEQHETGDGRPTALSRERHSSTVWGNSSVESVTNTISWLASSFNHPIASTIGRPANSRAVTCTAPTSGGTRNGSSSTGSISSAKRVRITIALNNVPTATNPTVARAMTPTSGSSTCQAGTSKNSTNSGKPTASTTATNTRFAISLPQYRLVRDSGETSSPSSAWFSSSSANARFSASIAANVNVTHRMLGEIDGGHGGGIA